MCLTRINRHCRTVTLDLASSAQAHTHTQKHKYISTHSLSLFRTHTDANTNARWINVVLNLAYYKRSANASWVNRCPGHSSPLSSYKEHMQNHMPMHIWRWSAAAHEEIMRFYLLALCSGGTEIAVSKMGGRLK